MINVDIKCIIVVTSIDHINITPIGSACRYYKLNIDFICASKSIHFVSNYLS